jgi:hypothetical protein
MANSTTTTITLTTTGKGVKVQAPKLNTTYTTPNSGRTGVVRELAVKMTNGGYETLNIGFDVLDPTTGEVTRQWACVSPLA